MTRTVLRFAEAEHMHTAIEPPERYVSGLAVVLSRVDMNPRRLEFEIHGAIKRQPSLSNVALILGGVVGNAHKQIVCTRCWSRNSEETPLPGRSAAPHLAEQRNRRLADLCPR